MDQLFLKSVPILELIEKAGFEAYFVGGSVRDYILGSPINDVDIATSATPQEIKRIFPKTADIGIDHGTVLVITDSGTYEITTFRTESDYSDFRRPDSVQFVRSLTEDLQRRDFTMNAMAMDKSGNIIDPFNGRHDLAEKRIITVGNPHERFHEDALRMMRALRFVSQLDFELDQESFDSLKENAQIISEIAVERILVEFEKLLTGINKKRAFSLLLESGLYQYLPQFSSKKDHLGKLLNLPLHQLKATEIWSIIMVHTSDQDMEEALRAWKLPLKTIRNVQRIIKLVKKEPSFENSTIDVFQAGQGITVQAAKVKAALTGGNVTDAEENAHHRYNELIIKDMSDLAVKGTDLLIWHQEKPGPWVKEYLEIILKAVLNEELRNDKEEIKRWLEKCNLS
ncbi:tRNA nucleotidyltransferase (CCA-adding enzyme) [Peribacillus simplex]|uniref:CCA tRNA nucleotidyltransferase n=1 Tax=Peribacillus TaxID=2675229 RepID=UPI0024E1A31C|nr:MULTISPECIES: CCA tRNA nucleotidyltransferase [Peribacillus]MDF9760795.1 tRNA nucleotidyltransferase (CCA-adding enzyme) [Peribacillus simplex]MDV7765078.1 CCA tRNA nucleotidyltransferase [Peribacillus sp. CSMR9]MDW7614696.1 CCA tRNA nucleotidyltransferase [Peribacillus simplex]